jgi:peroxiredoxin
MATVSPGEYWLTGWNLTLADGKGRRWKARGGVLGMPPLQSRFDLRAGQKVAVPLAGPLGVSLAPVVQGRRTIFTMTFVGPLGDRCFEVSVDGKRPPQPWLKILDEKGNVVDRLRFSFGCSFLCRLSWRAPAGMSGTLRAVPEVDFGPFVVQPGQGTTFEIAANATDEDGVSEGRPAPDFTLTEPETGQSVSLCTLRGAPVVLNFFCGCAWCDAVAETWAKRPLPEGMHLVVVWNDTDNATPEGLRKFRERTGFKGRILVDPDHLVTLLYDSSECPKVWVLDAAGTIRHVNASRTEVPERIVGEATAAATAARPAVATGETGAAT